jgi:acetyl esterase/lipase
MPDDARADLAAAEEVIRLYPDAAPDSDMPPESTFRAPGGGGPDTTMLRNVSDPTITVYKPDPAKANGIGVIVAPGGGWRILAWEHEGTWLAKWLAERGYAAFLLKYRLQATPADPEEFARSRLMPGPDVAKRPSRELPRSIASLIPGTRAQAARDNAVADGRAALALIRERAGEFGVDGARIGMIGFSAGAFLTVGVALDPGGPPLAFAAPIYGGEIAGAAIPADAPPLFIAVAGDDRMLVRVVEGLHNDWVDADRPSELHVFTRGGHGFGLAPQNKPVDRWLSLFEDWLKDQGLA